MNNEVNQLRLTRRKSSTFFIKSEDNKYYPVVLDDINWISATGNYCTIYANDKKFVVRISLAKIKGYLLQSPFAQINKKDLINIHKIKMYNPLGVVILGTKEFSVSRRFKKELESNLQFLP